MTGAALAEGGVVLALVVAIAVAAWLKARQTIRRERGRPRGIAPGTGDHIIDVEYSSGLGGGHATQIRVPRDPQAYARRFVPRAARGDGAGHQQGRARDGRSEREKDER
jgi:hypothetical protein